MSVFFQGISGKIKKEFMVFFDHRIAIKGAKNGNT